MAVKNLELLECQRDHKNHHGGVAISDTLTDWKNKRDPKSSQSVVCALLLQTFATAQNLVLLENQRDRKNGHGGPCCFRHTDSLVPEMPERKSDSKSSQSVLCACFAVADSMTAKNLELLENQRSTKTATVGFATLSDSLELLKRTKQAPVCTVCVLCCCRLSVG